MTEPSVVAFRQITSGPWSGVRISRKEGNLVRSIGVATDADGNLKAVQSFEPLSDDRFFIQAKDVDEPCRWPWSLLTGTPDHNILTAMNIDLADDASKRELAMGLERYAARLNVDHEAVAVLSKSSAPKFSLIPFYTGSDEKAANRRQQAGLFPIFSDIMASRMILKIAIDRREGSLIEKLAAALSNERYTISPAIVKRFAAAERFPDDCDLNSVLEFTAYVPPDWVPKGGQDFDAYCHLATAVFEHISDPVSLIPTLIKGSGGKWTEVLNRLTKAAYPPPRPPRATVPEGTPTGTAIAAIEPPEEAVIPPPPEKAVGISLRGVKDMVQIFTDNVVLPLAAHSQSSDQVFLTAQLRLAAEKTAEKIILSGRTVVEIVDLSRRFHQERYRVVEGSPVLQQARKTYVAAAQAGGGWPGLTADVQAPNGLWLVPLKSTPQLQDEGKKLYHCVGGYTAKAERCQSHIVSVRKLAAADSSVRSLSTAEISGISGPEGPFKVLQHYTTGNTTPSIEAQAAMNWYISSLQAGKIDTNWDLIRLFKSAENKNIDAVERYCQYDWRDPDMLFEATVPWYPFLTKAFKAYDLAGLVDCPEVREISDLIPPDILRMKR